MLPFDEKSHLAHMLDRLTFRVLLFTGSLVAGFMLYRQPIPACIGGIALYVVAFVLGAWLQRERMNKKESELRKRIGGVFALEELMFMKRKQAHAACARLISNLASLEIECEEEDGTRCFLHDEKLLVRCIQEAPGETTGCSAVLSALRIRYSSEVDRIILCTTTHFTPSALEYAQQYDEQIRLIDSAVLLRVSGRLKPATDEQMDRLSKRKRGPLSWPRIKPHVFSPEKKRRYLTFSFTLLMLYLWTDRLYHLFPALLCFLLAIGAHRAANRPFRL